MRRPAIAQNDASESLNDSDWYLMSLFSVPLHTITRADLTGLIDNAVGEGMQMEYKQELPGGADADKREFLADVSAFANTHGGDILFGVQAKHGVANGLPGLPTATLDSAVLRLESLLRDGIEPRLPAAAFLRIPLDNDRAVLVLRIQRSWQSPHMVSHGNVSRFFGRNAAGKYQLDVSQLRGAFLRSATELETAGRFRIDRLSQIASGDTPISLYKGTTSVLHLLPVGSLHRAVDIHSAERARPRPLFTDNSNARFNLNGVVFTSVTAGEPQSGNYLQVFRHGAIESVSSRLITADSGQRLIYTATVEPELFNSSRDYLGLLKGLDVGPPIVLMLSILGLQGYKIIPASEQRAWKSFRNPIPQNEILFPDVLIEDMDADPTVFLRPILDMLWQAAGWERCENYDGHAKWSSR